MDISITLLDLCRRARSATTTQELYFLLANETRSLVNYRQSVLWFEHGGIQVLSGVVQLETNAPYAHWINRVCKHLHSQSQSQEPVAVLPSDLPPDLGAEWHSWLPIHAFWFPLSETGGFLLASDTELNVAMFPWLAEWMDAWQYSWRIKYSEQKWPNLKPKKLWHKICDIQPDKLWWQQSRIKWFCAIVAILFFPVSLTVLAPAELVTANPAVIRAPLDGVIKEIYVLPNQAVTTNQPLFNFDEATLSAHLQVSLQALATTQAEYRQVESQALTEQKARSQLAVLLGKIEEQRAEATYLQEQLDRAKVFSPKSGIVIFDDPSEWIGRPVQTGERVMRVADPHDTEIEVWLPLADAIPLPDNASVRLYLAASPLSSIAAKVRYMSHDAQLRPDGSYAYRVRAKLESATAQRIGLKGTARVYGRWVPFFYWVIRHPLATIRQKIGV